MIDISDGLLGREIELGEIAVTADMIAAYREATGAPPATAPNEEAPATFCLALRSGMRPEVALPPGYFGLYGGHDLEFLRPIRAGNVYRISGRLAAVYDKSGRSGTFTVIVREAIIRETSGAVAARIIERQILRRIPQKPDEGRHHE